ncbi:MAG: hypothetical protein QOH39_3002 [Verrucomicrobiota bacterium]|jgi:hypothetical protein
MDERRRRNFTCSLGQRPGFLRIKQRVALKARFIFKPESSRAFSALFLWIKDPGALPQANGDMAPSAPNPFKRRVNTIRVL